MKQTSSRLGWCALPLALAALAAPASAPAATIHQAADGAVVFTGGPGATGLDIDAAGDGRVRFSPGLGDEITAVPASCERAEDDPYLALCAPPGAGVRVVLGDGDDGAAVRSPLAVPLVVDGGDGADVLSGVYEGGGETLLGGTGDDSVNGRGGDDVVDGGEGDDTVKGGPGADTVRGGAGTDALSGDDDASVSADVLDGGPGLDTVEQEWSPVGREGRGPVSVTLGGEADDGFAGERDDVRDVERLASVSGGGYVGTDGGEVLLVGGEAAAVDARGGDDTVYTSYSADTIRGGAGNDEIRGYAGDDTIAGGPGADTIAGDTVGQVCNVLTCSIYSGNDIIEARDGERDSIDCGLGTDELLADPVDVHVNCEDVVTGATDRGDGGSEGGPGDGRGARIAIVRRSVRRALARGLIVRVSGARPGRLAVVARRGRTLVARGAIGVAADGTGRGTVRFTRAGRRRLRSVRRLTLRVSAGAATTRVRLGS